MKIIHWVIFTIFLSFVWFFLTVLGIFIRIVEWFRADLWTWVHRFWWFGISCMSIWFAFFGIHMVSQSFNATDIGARIVVCFTGILVFFLAIAFFVKFSPKKEYTTN
jgi:hypothetical protein